MISSKESQITEPFTGSGWNHSESYGKKERADSRYFHALNTFGRKLNRNVHLHVSITHGGLTVDNTWKSLFFKSHILMKMWRYAVLKLLRTENREGLLNSYPELGGQPLSIVFANQYAKYWRVHCAKPHNNPKKDIEYLGRYIKRPAIANSRLVHYSGTALTFKYLNHRTKKTEYTQLHPFEFITRFIEPIPEKGFRLIRYFGFLANRVRGKLLPLVPALFNHEPNPKKHSWGYRVLRQTGENSLSCILCKNPMHFSFLFFVCTHLLDSAALAPLFAVQITIIVLLNQINPSIFTTLKKHSNTTHLGPRFFWLNTDQRSFQFPTTFNFL